MSEPGEPKPPMRSALRDLVGEKSRALTEHPELDELLAYAERRLEGERAERLKDHLALCRSCADKFLDFKAFSDEVDTRKEPGARAETAWRELQWRIQGEEEKKADVSEIPSEAKEPETVPRRKDPEVLPEPANDYGPSSWPKVMAAVLAIAVVGLMFPYLQGKKGTKEAPAELFSLEANAPSEREPGTRGLNVDGGAEAKRLSAGKHLKITIALPVQAILYEDFRIEVVSLPGDAIEVSQGGSAPGEKKEVVLDLPAGKLSPGSYEIRVYGLKDGGSDRLVGQKNIEVSE